MIQILLLNLPIILLTYQLSKVYNCVIYWDVKITYEKSNTIRFNINSFVTHLWKKNKH